MKFSVFTVIIFDTILLKKGPIKIAQTFREFLPIGNKKICLIHYVFVMTSGIGLVKFD